MGRPRATTIQAGGGPATTGPSPGVVEVWLVALAERPSPADLALLDPSETVTAAQYSSPRLAAAFVGGRAAVRRIVGAALGIRPADVPIAREPCPQCAEDSGQGHGRPRIALADCMLRFSLSRAGSLAAVAIADGCDVGVDVEAVRTVNLAALGRHTLAPAEVSRVAQAPPRERSALFLRSWCRKEAVTKAAGIGIATDLRALDTQPDQSGPVRVNLRIGARTTAWDARELPVPDGVVGAVAWPFGAARELVMR